MLGSDKFYASGDEPGIEVFEVAHELVKKFKIPGNVEIRVACCNSRSGRKGEVLFPFQSKDWSPEEKLDFYKSKQVGKFPISLAGRLEEELIK